MIRRWMGGFDGIGSYSVRNYTETDMISWREALVPISIFCNPVLWFLVGFLLISCCRDEKGFWRCPCRRRQDRATNESAKTSTTNICTPNQESAGGLYSQLDLDLGLRLTGTGTGALVPSRSRSLRQARAGGRSRYVPRARSAQLLSTGAARPVLGPGWSAAAPSPGRRSSSPQLVQGGCRDRAVPAAAPPPPPPPSHILLTPAELHGRAPGPAASSASLPPPPPVRPLRRSLDDRMLRPRLPSPLPAGQPTRPCRRSLEEHGSWGHGGADGDRQTWRLLERYGSRQEVSEQHQHISLQMLPLPALSASPRRPRPLSLQETHQHLQPIAVETASRYQTSPQKERPPPAYQSLVELEQAASYHSWKESPHCPSFQQDQPPLCQPCPETRQLKPDAPLAAPTDGADCPLGPAGLDPAALYRIAILPPSPSDRPGQRQRVSLQEVRLTPAAAAAVHGRPRRVSLQEAGAHGVTGDVQRRGRKCGVFGHQPACRGRPWTLDLAHLTEN